VDVLSGEKGGQLRTLNTEKSGRMTMLKRLLLSATALSALAGAAVADDDGARTARSIGVNLTAGTFLITTTKTYQFDLATAETFYTTTTPTLAFLRCTNNNNLAGGCTSSEPSTPAPPPLMSEVVNQANSDECTFANGGTLGGTPI
jgi:hypothetical protein